ncbi:GntR family transcriptional regulator [Pseudorhodoplanes sp.]|uniref:GntR family transcriptional regulator n=1 Tax=Pseudorhodoplanes sp. TaxID=1934341 RepID=UPI00391CE84C
MPRLQSGDVNISQDVKPPLTEHAYRLLRDRILRKSLVGGEKLKLDELQREYRLSSSPLREALNRLVAENLVIADDRRGFRAAPTTIEDLEDLTSIRIIVEPGALAASMRLGSDDWEARVVAAYHRLDLIERRIAAGELQRDDDWTERHKAFHISLASACGSGRLVELCSKLFDQSERYRRLSASLRRKPRNTIGEHTKLMEAALARDEAAPVLLREHIERTTAHVAPALRGAAGRQS